VSNTIGEELPVSFYHELVRWFSKDGNTAVEVGCGSEVGSYSLFVYDNIHLEHVNFFEDVVNGVTKGTSVKSEETLYETRTLSSLTVLLLRWLESHGSFKDVFVLS